MVLKEKKLSKSIDLKSLTQTNKIKAAFLQMAKCSLIRIFFKLGFTPCKAEQPLQGMELQEKEAPKD